MRRACLLVLLLAGCRTDPPALPPVAPGPAAPPAALPPSVAADSVPDPRPPAVVFDTTEPPELPVAIEPRPPAPEPAPLPEPRPPAPSGPAGSCDVSAAEGFCFAYVGPAWSPAAARAHCAEAPGARFRAVACPTDGRIATCAFARASAPGRDLLYTYYEPADPTLAELACPGTFERLDE